MSVFKGHDDLSLNRYYYSFYSFSQDDPNTIKSFVYDQNQTLVSSKDISFNTRNIPDMLSFLENSQSNPYALGKSNDEFLNMDITFAGLYKKALTEKQQQSLMTSINKTYKNVFYGTVNTFTIQVTQSANNSTEPVFIFNGDTSVENPMVSVGTVGLYIFDQSHPSNAGFPIAFRNMQSPFTPYTNVIVEGTPGTPNSYSLVSITDVSAPLLVEYYTTSTETNAEFISGELLNYLYQVKVETNIVGDPVFAIQSPGQSAYVLQPDLSFNIGDLEYFYVGDDSMADISLVFGPTVDDTTNVIGSPYYVKKGDIILLDLTSGYTGDPLVYFEDSSAGMGYVASGGGADTNIEPTVLWYNFDISNGNTIANDATGSSLGDAIMTRSSIVTDVSKTGTGSLLCVRDSGQMQYVTLPSLILPNEFTMCFWHKMTPDSGFATNIYLLYFMGVNTNATYNSQYAIDIEVNNGNFEIILNHSAGVTRYYYGAYPNDNAWHHLMFIKSSTESTFKVYIDNSEKTPDKTVNMGTFSTSTYNSHYISGRPDLLTSTANYHMGGHTDDYRFYNIALDDTQRDTVYNYAPTQIATYTVDVSNNSIFRLDSGDGNGFDEKPLVTFNDGTTYIFDQSDSTNANNTLIIGTTFDDPASIVSSGLTIVGTPGQPGAYTKYVSDGSTVYYFSYQTSNMGYNPTP